MIGGSAPRRHAASKSAREPHNSLGCRFLPLLLAFLFQPLFERSDHGVGKALPGQLREPGRKLVGTRILQVQAHYTILPH